MLKIIMILILQIIFGVILYGIGLKISNTYLCGTMIGMLQLALNLIIREIIE